MTSIGLIIPPDQRPERFLEAGHAAEAAELDDVWLWEDCFAESGIAPAASILAATSRIRVGLGLMPVPLRNVALTAMEIATIERMFPGRFMPGIGHGVLEWMEQVGERVASPMTLLREQAVALRSLLAGAEVTTAGAYVSLDRVQLRWPPVTPPPLLVGAVRAKTIALAGELGDGLILSGDQSADAVRAAVELARDEHAGGEFEVVAFTSLPFSASVGQIVDTIGAFAEAGATRVPVLALDGPPVSDERILTFADHLGAARDALHGA